MKRTKYNAKKVVLDNISFDSEAEAKYYATLKYLQAQGKVYGFELQPEIVLIPSFKLPCGTTQRAITYTPDFKVIYADGSVELIDVKGFSPEVGNLKRKMYNALQTGTPLRWVSANKKYGDEYGFIDYDDLVKKRREAKRNGDRRT